VYKTLSCIGSDFPDSSASFTDREVQVLALYVLCLYIQIVALMSLCFMADTKLLISKLNMYIYRKYFSPIAQNIHYKLLLSPRISFVLMIAQYIIYRAITGLKFSHRSLEPSHSSTTLEIARDASSSSSPSMGEIDAEEFIIVEVFDK
jgi:hypothetical protein